MQTETTEVLMPLMGEGITEATLVKWLKQPGDALRKDEPLLEVSTDKVDTEIPSPAAGTLLKVFAKDGDVVAVNEIVALIGNPDGAGSFNSPATGSLSKDAGSTGNGSGGGHAGHGSAGGGHAGHGSAGGGHAGSGGGHVGAGGGQAGSGAGHAGIGGVGAAGISAGYAATGTGAVASGAEYSATGAPGSRGATSEHTPLAPGRRSSPLVRKMAKEHRIDLGQVPGTGLNGRITKRDIESHQAQSKPSHSQNNNHAGHAVPPAPSPAVSPALKTRKEGGIETLEGVPVRREKMSRMRSLIAEHMVRSVRTSPHVTTVFEIDMHRVVKMREKNKAAFAVREGFNLTFTPFFVYAAVQAIKRFPAVNCSVDGDDILWKDQINMGVAVAIDSGLIVPVIRDAGELSVLGIARRLNDLAGRARSKKLLPEDVQGGTFSVTNPGMFGSIVSTPIINQPQVAILSIGAIVKRPVVIDDLIGIRPLVQIGLTFDHRVVDGEGGARYLAFLKKTLEEFPESEL